MKIDTPNPGGLYKCKTCDGDVVLRQVTGHVRTSYKHVGDVECSAMLSRESLGDKPLDIIGTDDVYAVPARPKEEPCDCGPRKSCPACTENPNPICPCGAHYNFTCYCTRAQIDAFKAGREFEAQLIQAQSDTKNCDSCKTPATWVRCTQFSGDHYFCTQHAEQQENFGKYDPSYFFWKHIATGSQILNNHQP